MKDLPPSDVHVVSNSCGMFNHHTPHMREACWNPRVESKGVLSCSREGCTGRCVVGRSAQGKASKLLEHSIQNVGNLMLGVSLNPTHNIQPPQSTKPSVTLQTSSAHHMSAHPNSIHRQRDTGPGCVTVNVSGPLAESNQNLIHLVLWGGVLLRLLVRLVSKLFVSLHIT